MDNSRVLAGQYELPPKKETEYDNELYSTS